MDEATAIRLYALALGLVPDENAAVEIFRAALDENDLRLRAGRWREAQGLPAPPLADVLPPLDAEQREHAVGLRRRAERQRRLRPWLLAGGAAVLVAVAVFFGVGAIRAHSGLAAARVFTETPLGTSEPVHGLRLSVFKAVATPASVTVWWAISGPEAAYEGMSMQPALNVAGSPMGLQSAPKSVASGWVEAEQSQVQASGNNRLLGRSTYRVAGLFGADVRVGRIEIGGRPVDWEVRAAVAHTLDDPDAREVRLDLSQVAAGFRVTLKSVTLGSDYTAVRFSTDAPIQQRDPRPSLQVVVGTGQTQQRLRPIGGWDLGSPPERAVLYQSLPAGASYLMVYFQTPIVTEPTPYTISMPGAIPDLQRQGNRLTGTLMLHGLLFVGGDAHFTDQGGHTYPVTLQPSNFRNRADYVYQVLAQVPDTAQLTDLTLTLARVPDVLVFPVDLGGSAGG